MDNPTPSYSTKLFCQVWEDYDAFKDDLDLTPAASCLSAELSRTTFWLLNARFKNNPIANLDEAQWKDRVFAVIFQFGPAWEKRLDIQSRLRSLTEEDIIVGAKSINNTALNPGDAPSTSALQELPTINNQSTNQVKKSKMDAYSQLWGILSLDVTEEFLSRFKKLFKAFVAPEYPTLYVSEEE